MRKNIQYTAILLALAVTASCNKIVNAPDGDDLIRFAPQAVGTKALINDEDGLQTQTFDVVDLLDGAAYIKNTVAYSGGWGYTSPASAIYMWKNGSHKFFGYTSGIGTLSTSNKLPVSKVLTTAEANQTDLLYSDVFATTFDAWKAANAKGDPVPLHFNHLFSAVSITVKNTLGADKRVVVNSVSKPAIPNSGSAEVDFTTMVVDENTGEATDTPVVTYTAPVVSGDFVATAVPANIELAANSELDVLNAGVTTAKSDQMVWPQTLAKGAVSITVSYTVYDGEDDTTGKTYENKTVSLPAVTWEAGKKYDYTLLILPTEIRLTFVVQPWNGIAVGAIDTSTGSINMSNVTWQNTNVKLTADGEETKTVLNNAYSVNMFYKPYYKNTSGNWVQYTANNGYFPAQGYFTVNYPKEGVYKIGLMPAKKSESTPDPEAVFDATMYEIYIYKQVGKDEQTGDPIYDWVKHNATTGETITNDTVYFQVRAASGQDHKEHKAQVNIWFKGTGEKAEWISAYSEVRANYALIIPATPNN